MNFYCKKKEKTLIANWKYFFSLQQSWKYPQILIIFHLSCVNCIRKWKYYQKYRARSKKYNLHPERQKYPMDILSSHVVAMLFVSILEGRQARLCVKLCLITIIILAGRKGRNVYDMEIRHDAIGSN